MPQLIDERNRQVEQCHLVDADNLDDSNESEAEIEWGADPFSILSQAEEISGRPLKDTR